MRYLTLEQIDVVKEVIKESMRQAFINSEIPIPDNFEATTGKVTQGMIDKVQIKISETQKLKK